MPDSFDFPQHIQPDLLVRLKMEERAKDAGAQNKISGYRGHMLFEGFEVGSMGWFKFDGGTAIRGQDAAAEIALMSPQLYAGKIDVGTRFAISEGHTLIATGTVMELLSLAENAERMRNTEDG